MTHFLFTCFATMVASTLFSAAPVDQPTSEIMRKLKGVWDVEEGVNQGTEIPEEELEGTTMKINKNTIITYDRDENEVYRCTFTLDVSTKPISIDMTTTMKSMPPTKSLGILRFEEDDEFEICYALPGGERPKKFESPKGSKIMLFEVEKED